MKEIVLKNENDVVDNLAESECDAVKNQKRDVAQKETVSDESEIDMQRDNLLDQLHTFYNSLAGCWKRLTLSEREYIDQQYEMLKSMIQLLH